MKKTVKKAAKKAPATKTPAKKTAKKVVKKAVKNTLLAKGEPAPFTTLNKTSKKSFVIVCDHASNRVPKALKNLGLGKADLQKHIAWDPGTADIGRYLAKKTGATAVLASYSRLVVDLNRGHDNKECMRSVSDHVKVPANKGLSAKAKKERLDALYWPYHAEIDRCMNMVVTRKGVPLLVSIHSFTPEMDGFKRPWHIGVLWNKEAGIAKKLVQNLRAKNPKLVIGENEPYSLMGHGTGKDTVRRHAELLGYPYVIVEFRQDLVATKKGADQIAKIFHAALAPILADKSVYKKRALED